MIRSAEKNGERTDTMEKSDIRYQAYVSILEEELKPAMGCTEPIAIAYCAAVAREVLGGLPEKVKGRRRQGGLRQLCPDPGDP